MDPVYDPIAAFAATVAAHGVKHVVISPGSRSTPLAVTFHAQPALRTWIQLDERSAGFFALGIGRATGRPAVLVCTSGTAAANYLPAVVEAHHAGVPMIVCTADRPPELRDWGAGQTIDQVGLYGTATRWATDLPVAGDWTPQRAAVAAHRAVDAATGADPGPVHLNWPLREPLEPVGAVPVHDRPTVHRTPKRSASADVLEEIAGIERGVVVVGPHDGIGLDAEHEHAEAILRFAAARGWPVIAEPLTQLRRGRPHGDAIVITNADHLLADPAIAAAVAPDVVVRIGRSPTTKRVRTWLEGHRPDRVVLIDPAGHWHDASFTVTDHVALPAPVALAVADEGTRGSDWLESWRRMETAAGTAVAAETGSEFGSAGVVRTLVDAVPEGSVVMVSNSMPVRDLDAFVPVGGPPISVVGNRGASGIDGITSTALGIAAATDRPTIALMGDLALLHDLGALYGAARAGLHLTVVCVDNDGGAIFSMLPIADRADEVDVDTLFRTPHGLDLEALGGTGGLRTTAVASIDELAAALLRTTGEGAPGVDLLLVRVDADADMAARREITAAVLRAVDAP